MNKDIVIVIKSVNYSEADKVLTVFGKQFGKFALFAKGIRKINSKNRGNMQTLSTSEVSFYEGKGMPLLTESQLVSTLDYDNLMVADIRRVLFLLNKILQEYDPAPQVFDLLQSALNKNLDIESTNKFRIKFLSHMGFLQDLSTCASCNGKENLKYLDYKDFALICENCYIKGRGKPLGDSPYSSSVLTSALDKYIKKIVEEI